MKTIEITQTKKIGLKFTQNFFFTSFGFFSKFNFILDVVAVVRMEFGNFIEKRKLKMS